MINPIKQIVLGCFFLFGVTEQTFACDLFSVLQLGQIRSAFDNPNFTDGLSKKGNGDTEKLTIPAVRLCRSEPDLVNAKLELNFLHQTLIGWRILNVGDQLRLLHFANSTFGEIKDHQRENVGHLWITKTWNFQGTQNMVTYLAYSEGKSLNEKLVYGNVNIQRQVRSRKSSSGSFIPE